MQWNLAQTSLVSGIRRLLHARPVRRTVGACLLVAVTAGLLLTGCDSAGPLDDTNDEPGDTNDPPTASVQAPSDVTVGNQVTLDGSGSSDPDGDDLSFSWTLNTPSGSNATLSDDTAEQPTFTPDVDGNYTAELEVSDGQASDTDEATLTAAPGDQVEEINSNVESDRTLTPDNNYVVTSTVCVENSSTLTIEDGVQIEFESGTGLKVCGDGSALVANGTASDGILMTGTTQQAGFWQGVGINSSNQNNELSGVTIEYAGSSNLYNFVNEPGGLQIKEGTAVTIANTTIRNNANYGLTAEGGVDLSGFSSNTFAGNEKMAMNVNAGAMGAPDGASSFESPVRVNGGNITGKTLTISALGVPYQIAGVRQIEGGSDVTVAAGTVMEFESGAGLVVDGDATAFKAEGADAERIVMTGTTKQRGFWQGLGIRSANTTNRLDHVNLKYAGGNNLFNFVNGKAGVQIKEGASLTIVQDSIGNNANYGVSAESGADLSGFSSNVITLNEKKAMNVGATHMGAVDADSYFGSPVRISDGSITGETLTVADLNVPYRVAGVRVIDEGSDVTINPGTVIEFETEAGFDVSDDPTVFKAQGAEADSIRFRGVVEQKGSWEGLGIDADNVSNVLDYVVVAYGGGNNIYNRRDPANIQVRGQLTLTNSRIVDSAGYGLSSDDGASDVSESSNTYRRNDRGARNF